MAARFPRVITMLSRGKRRNNVKSHRRNPFEISRSQSSVRGRDDAPNLINRCGGVARRTRAPTAEESAAVRRRLSLEKKNAKTNRNMFHGCFVIDERIYARGRREPRAFISETYAHQHPRSPFETRAKIIARTVIIF